MQRNSAPVTRGDLASERAERRARERETERKRKRKRVWTRGLLTRNEPITPRDRCYLFIILLNVEAPRPVDRSSSTAIVPKYSSGLMSARGWIALDPFDSTEKTLLLTFATDKTCTLYANSLMGSEFIIEQLESSPEVRIHLILERCRRMYAIIHFTYK